MPLSLILSAVAVWSCRLPVRLRPPCHPSPRLCWCAQVDKTGRVIDADRHKGKLHIIEQEFANVEREEEERRKEEEEIRRRVRVKRHEAIERAQQLERLNKIREDRRIRSEIVRIARGEVMRSSLAATPASASASRMKTAEAAYRSGPVRTKRRRKKRAGGAAGGTSRSGRLARAGADSLAAGGLSGELPSLRPREEEEEEDDEDEVGFADGPSPARGEAEAWARGGGARAEAAAGHPRAPSSSGAAASAGRLVVAVLECVGADDLPAAAEAEADAGATRLAYVRARLVGPAAGEDELGPASHPRSTARVPLTDGLPMVWGEDLALPVRVDEASASAEPSVLRLELVIPQEFSAHDVAAVAELDLPLPAMLRGSAAASMEPHDIELRPPREVSLAQELAGDDDSDGGGGGPTALLRVGWRLESAR